ncbi:uncharacterized protein LOC144442596 [Glandiceps talaboti]
MVNKTCSTLCGITVFISGALYFLLVVCMTIYCYVPIPGLDTTGSVICLSIVDQNQFIDMVTLTYILLLLTTGCLGVAAAKLQTESVSIAMLISAMLTFFVSNIFLLEKTLTLYALIQESSGAFGGADLSNVTNPLVIDSLYLLCAAGGFFAGLACVIIACKGVCNKSKVGTS